MKNTWIERYIYNFGEDSLKYIKTKKQAIKECIENEKEHYQKCPICNKIVFEQSWSDERSLVETNVKCKNHWEESWAYGLTQHWAYVNKKGRECYFGDSAEEDEIMKQLNKYEEGVRLARKEYEKRLNIIKNRRI